MERDGVEVAVMLAQNDCDKCWQGDVLQGARLFLRY